MIDFTDEQVERAATAIKVIRLVNQGLDVVAVKLNCEPRHDEIVEAHTWALALGMATTMRPFDIAAKIAEKRR